MFHAALRPCRTAGSQTFVECVASSPFLFCRGYSYSRSILIPVFYSIMRVGGEGRGWRYLSFCLLLWQRLFGEQDVHVLYVFVLSCVVVEYYVMFNLGRNNNTHRFPANVGLIPYVIYRNFPLCLLFSPLYFLCFPPTAQNIPPVCRQLCTLRISSHEIKADFLRTRREKICAFKLWPKVRNWFFLWTIT